MTDQVLIWLLFEQEGATLLVRRKPDRRPLAGQWTLPGDRMEADESASEAVARFARDELDVSVRDEEFVDTFFLEDGGMEYAVNVFRPRFEGRLRYRESGPFDEARWVSDGDAPALQGAPRPLVELLQGKRHWQGDEQERQARD